MNGTKMEVFQNKEFGSVRVVMLDGAPWFSAADVCKALDIANSRDAIAKLDADEKMTVGLTDGHSGARGGAQKMGFVNEPGLYALMMRSRKPEAKAFQRWIIHEVIPCIRKHGGYLTESLLEQVLQEPQLIYQLAETMLRERQKNAALEAELRERFYFLSVRDRTVPKQALWASAGEDTLRGHFLSDLKARYEQAEEEDQKRKIAAAARLVTALMDGREAAL